MHRVLNVPVHVVMILLAVLGIVLPEGNIKLQQLRPAMNN